MTLLLSVIETGPSIPAIEAGLLTEFSAGLAIVGVFAALTAVLRLLRGR